MMTLIMLGLGAWPAPAAPAPRRVALVLVNHPGLHQPWQGSTRLAQLERVVLLEMRTLPLDAQAGLWVVEGEHVQTPVPPAPSLELKSLGLILEPTSAPPAAGALAQALASAAQWAGQSPGGAVVLWAPAELAPPAAPPGVFLHAVLVQAGTPPDLAAWGDLTLAGGGALLVAAAPGRLSPLAHRAVQTALSRSTLLIQAHDPRNQALDLTVGLERRDQLATNRRARGGRPAQVLAGVYQLTWPQDGDLGPGEPPAKVEIDEEGETLLVAGGQAKLRLVSRDASGQELHWQARVSAGRSGHMYLTYSRLPQELELPAGDYVVQVMHPPISRPVDLSAGQDLELVLGPWGTLLLDLSGPQGPARVPYQARDLTGGGASHTGYTGQPLRLLPGRYQVRLQLPHAPRLEVRVGPDAQTRQALPPVGGVMVRRAPGQGLLRYVVNGADGAPLARGSAGMVVLLPPGTYRLEPVGPGPARELVIQPGRLTLVQP